MILTVTANAAIDHTSVVRGVAGGRVHRALEERRQAGGKGVNVARVGAVLGLPVRAVVVVGGATGDEILRDLERSGLSPRAVAAAGESRTCIELIDAGCGAATQVHGPGVRATDATARALTRMVAEELGDASWLVLAGSLAPGMPPTLYAELVQLARAQGVPVAVDASGLPLALAIAERPDLVRINRQELRAAQEALTANEEAPGLFMSAERMLAVVSDGANPIEARRGVARRWRLIPPAISYRNGIGCGDAMLAGIIAEFAGSEETALRFGTALGSAAAESPYAGEADVARASRLTALVRLESDES